MVWPEKKQRKSKFGREWPGETAGQREGLEGQNCFLKPWYTFNELTYPRPPWGLFPLAQPIKHSGSASVIQANPGAVHVVAYIGVFDIALDSQVLKVKSYGIMAAYTPISKGSLGDQAESCAVGLNLW